VAEWSNVPDSKSGVGATLPRVRIPPSPPVCFNERNYMKCKDIFPTTTYCLPHVFTTYADL
jgi:hypothetical protein